MKKLLLLFVFVFQAFCLFSQTLLIYGGDNHDVYLGKLNGGEFDSESIWNENGTYGNRYNSNSIWNEYGTFGSEYSQYSPFNQHAENPPVIVDSSGSFYGYLTVNEYKRDRANNDIANAIYRFYEYIREDVGKWYDKLFY